MTTESARRTDVRADPLERLAERIRTKQATVAVVGLGYVGLPLLVSVARSGFPVVGFDVDDARVESLQAGRSYVGDVTDAEVASLDRVEFQTDPAALAGADVVLICVPTPLTDHTPDLAIVREAVDAVGRHLTPGRLVVLESTTYPGTTEEVVAPILESASGLTAGRDFALGYSPERIDPGQDLHRLEETPKIVSGLTDRCRDLAASFYSQVIQVVVVVPSPREAEMAKLIENTFRQVNIALVNELAVMARDLHVDIWEALRAASTKPFGYMPFWPGPGVGGHCIAIDPSYLSWRVGQQLGYHIGFIEHANEVNNRMPAYVVDRIGDALNDADRPVRGSRVLAIGVTYKPGVDDQRGSPSLMVMERLAAKGALVAYHDPFVPNLQLAGTDMESQELTEEVLSAQDCVTILTAHPTVDYASVIATASLVFDARGATMGMDGPNVVRL
ncbi:MAG TPA: nucleotide sugar dehydrogenase [Actinomycetota bacterium]|nr:nucleotide sugar dehydrogenase [Actinomycetota bacterium]